MIVAAASNGQAAVAVTEINGHPVVLRYAPMAIGRPDRSKEFAALFCRAAEKIGWFKKMNGQWAKL